MDPSGDDHIAYLLRLKRYEQPPPAYFENSLHEFHRRQCERDELLRQSLWRTCVECAEDFALRINIRSLAPAGIAVLVASAALFSIRLHQQSDTTQLAVQSSPVPSTPSNIENELDVAPPAFNARLDIQPTLRSQSRDIRLLPVDPLGSDEFVPLNLEWESLEDHRLLPKK
jgi:hypothetical protein